MTPAARTIDRPPPAPAAGEWTGDALARVRTTCVLVLAVLAGFAALAWLRPVVVPFLVALALFYLLSPVRGWLVRRFGLPDTIGVVGAGAVGLAVVATTGALAWACVAQVTRDADVFAARAAELAEHPAVADAARRLGAGTDPGAARAAVLSPEQARDLVLRAADGLRALVTDTFLVLVFLLFMLFGGGAGPRPGGGWPDEVAGRVRVYLTETFVFSLVIGVLVGAVLAVLGVKFWLAFGFLAFVLNFIPTVGPIVAALLPVPVVLLDPELADWAKVLALAVPPTIHGVIANVIQPRFQSRTQGVHPVPALVALIVFGMLWGPVGAVLAVPLAAVLRIAFDRVPGGRPFADLLAGHLHGPPAVLDGSPPVGVNGDLSSSPDRVRAAP